jgi:hypothetical protein
MLFLSRNIRNFANKQTAPSLSLFIASLACLFPASPNPDVWSCQTGRPESALQKAFVAHFSFFYVKML